MEKKDLILLICREQLFYIPAMKNLILSLIQLKILENHQMRSFILMSKTEKFEIIKHFFLISKSTYNHWIPPLCSFI